MAPAVRSTASSKCVTPGRNPRGTTFRSAAGGRIKYGCDGGLI